VKPAARTSNVLIEELDDELVVYDRENDQAHSLNRTAALVWRACDGTRTIAEIAASLRRQGIPVGDDDLVQLSVDLLANAGLIDSAAARRPLETRLARRQLLERIGVVGAGSLVLPAIETLDAPRAVAAVSEGAPSCSPCTSCR
jgi:hypothetical protein